MGWTPVLVPAPGPRLVAAAAPHTADADFWPALFWIWATRSPVRWVGKSQLFKGPQAAFFRAVGGIPVDRNRKGGNFVDAVVDIIRREDEIILAVAPEGSRARGTHWKTGFYYMALEAGVPIGIMVLDWQNKRVGITEYLTPTGDIDADFARIRQMLAGVRGKVPANETPAYPSAPLS